MKKISPADLHNIFIYNPATGQLLWRETTGRRSKAGTVAGTITTNGKNCSGSARVAIGINGVVYKAHRIVWAMIKGEWPEKEIDHINGDKTDNRIENLRTAHRNENTRNTRKRSSNTSGYKGVSLCKESGRWKATITAGKQIFLGRFDTPEIAHEAYKKASTKLHGDFSNHG